MQVLQRFLGFGNHRFPRLQCVHLATVEACHLVSVLVFHHDGQEELSLSCVLVLHLRLHMYCGLVSLDVEVRGIDVCSRGSKVAVEWQCLIKFVCQMQIDILGQSAVVGVEVFVVPLVAAVERAVAVGPTVVAAHGHDVLAHFGVGREVEAESHHAIVGKSHFLAVEPYVGTLACSFEFDEHLSLHVFFREGEVLAVPADGVGQVDDVACESLVFVEGMRQGDALPFVVVEGRSL